MEVAATFGEGREEGKDSNDEDTTNEDVSDDDDDEKEEEEGEVDDKDAADVPVTTGEQGSPDCCSLCE